MTNKEQNNINQYSSKSILYIAIMRHKKGFLICILLALLSSTFAWFYGSLVVSVQTNVDVESWSVKIGEDGGETQKAFTFSKVYPGVQYLHENPSDTSPGKNIITVENTGETPAYLTLEIQNLYLFGEKLIKYNESAYNADPTNYVSDYKVNSAKTTDVSTGKVTSAKYFIEGMPFQLTVNFPKTTLIPGDTTQIEFDLIWEYRGDITPTLVKRKNIVSNILEDVTEPKCSAQITSPAVLDYVKNQKQQYADAGIEINDTTIVEDEAGVVNISTCDIIDTYFGEKAEEFDAEKEGLTIKDDVYIEIAITASQTTNDTPTT